VTNLNRWHSEILSILTKEEGLMIFSVRGKKHKVVKGELNGNPFRWVVSSTPSQKVAFKMMLADLKRELRKCGIEKPPAFRIKFLSFETGVDDIFELIENIEREI